jgi:hypothetical protein
MSQLSCLQQRRHSLQVALVNVETPTAVRLNQQLCYIRVAHGRTVVKRCISIDVFNQRVGSSAKKQLQNVAATEQSSVRHCSSAQLVLRVDVATVLQKQFHYAFPSGVVVYVASSHYQRAFSFVANATVATLAQKPVQPFSCTLSDTVK